MCIASTEHDLIGALLQLMLVKLGAPTWLSIIIICWGIVATMFATLQNVFQFYALRLLLGVTESGTFPGMWFHMSCFYSGEGFLLELQIALLEVSGMQQDGAAPEKPLSFYA